MRLIITEKNNAAIKIAEILAAGKPKQQSFLKIPYYSLRDEEGTDINVIGLKGHVMQVEFPPEYADWQKVRPSDLISAPLVKGITAKSVVRAVKKLAEEADSLIIATDFDREGELIGLEALELAAEANPKLERNVRRARFSALTAGEINKAFSHLDHLAHPLAHAGEARQDIDLIWGATLTRFVSLSTRRLGNQFLSVGRVQSPTLVLVVEREKERRAFKPEPYWVVTVDLEAGGETVTAVHKEERFWEEDQARAVFEKLAGPAQVTEVKSTSRTTPRPAPFSTTSYTSAATSLGFSASAAMSIAEDLYMDGLISYPRTDNTVYPSSLSLREVLETLKAGQFAEEVKSLLARDKLTPSRGSKKTTDHPPIYPTGLPGRGQLKEREQRIYELVVRRFLATLADDAVSESTRVDFGIDSEPFFLRGSRVVVPGWFAYYPYARQRDTELPAFASGDLCPLKDKHIDGRETQPPARYGQGALIELMEKNRLGTKATRHNILQNLYDRGYIRGNPVEPTETGIKMAEALQEYAPTIAYPEMTAQLESDMDSIAERSLTREDVVDHSRQLLRQAYQSLESNKEQVASKIQEGIVEDRVVGDCPQCGRKLRIIRSKATKKRFVGCEGYPDCAQTYPLPQRGEIVPVDETCPSCGSPRIKVLAGRGRPWTLCLDTECPTKEEYKARRAQREAEAAGVAGGAAGAEGGDGSTQGGGTAAKTKPRTKKKTASRRKVGAGKTD